MVSFPAPPEIMSLPAAPVIASAPEQTVRLSTAAPPTIEKASDCPVKFKVEPEECALIVSSELIFASAEKV